jgi:type II secretory pathway component PulJ
MKKAFTVLEFIIALVFGAFVASMIYYFVSISSGSYTYEEMFWPEQTKAKYQREMVEELRRANDLKERE